MLIELTALLVFIYDGDVAGRRLRGEWLSIRHCSVAVSTYKYLYVKVCKYCASLSKHIADGVRFGRAFWVRKRAINRRDNLRQSQD